jgi:branched chain amino acid efflux pump
MRTIADLWPAVLGMASVTYGTRVGGFLIVGIVRDPARLSRVLQHLVTGVLTALVVSGLRESDAAVAMAALAAVILMRISGQFLLAIGGAAATAALLRLLLR